MFLTQRKRELERENAALKGRVQELEEKLARYAAQEARRARQWDALWSYTGQRAAEEEME